MESLDAMRVQLDGIGHVLSDNNLSVPKYQRSYAWEDEHVQDFFRDIETAIKKKENDYFLGSIVMTGNLKERLEVVDGQQRLATTTILIAAIRDFLYNNGDKNRAEDISRRYLMDRDLRSQEILPRLRLNEVDHDFFSKRVLSNPDDRNRNIQSLKSSHRLIVNASESSAKYVKSLTDAANNATEILLEWIEYLHIHAKVIYVAAPDYANAFIIFETLNDRGLELAISDLLKNYLFSLADDRIEEVQRRWISMVSVLEAAGKELDKELDIVTYIRHLWSSKDDLTREKDLYSKIKKQIKSKQDAVDFSDQLYINAKLYAAVLNPSHDFWEKFGPTARDHVGTLNLLGMIQMRPLILSVLDKFPVEEAKKALRVMVSWAVRFLIAGVSGSGTLENNYSQRAIKVRNGDIKNTKELIDAMKSVVPPDRQFLESFGNASVSKANIARYYLNVLERQSRNESEPALVPNNNSEHVNLEHILPQNPSDAWGYIDAETVKAYYNRIGNLTLLQRKLNSNIGNSGFVKKLEIYKKTQLKLTFSLDQYSMWGTDQIEQRQKWLAQLAVEAWPIKI